MPLTYRELFRILPESEPPRHTYDIIMSSVERFQVRRFRLRVAFFGTVSGTAAVASVPVVEYMITTANQSGFFQYLSLISDGQFLASHFTELATIIADSAPVVGLAGLAGIALVLTYSLGRMTSYIPALSVAQSKLALAS